ncbi:hypothetical protein SLEP1_g43827 [Rubroshorea leprosula]|uniref:Uncharacterized protein n=1 Tax=Rubroshorea leprosula TaxID=152421 RepID=A0AAV5LEK1_9ROSI|nr:hypothetical protein SLEP1_g43827 [Rubroshorea leprosula]
METADPRRENFMNVEQAIQIELAYRRKIAILNMETNNDSGQELISLQIRPCVNFHHMLRISTKKMAN